MPSSLYKHSYGLTARIGGHAGSSGHRHQTANHSLCRRPHDRLPRASTSLFSHFHLGHDRVSAADHTLSDLRLKLISRLTPRELTNILVEPSLVMTAAQDHHCLDLELDQPLTPTSTKISISPPDVSETSRSVVLSNMSPELSLDIMLDLAHGQHCQKRLHPGGLPDHDTTSVSPTGGATSDRSELIQRLKRGESPTWIPNRHLESILQQHRLPFLVARNARPTTDLLTPSTLSPAADIVTCNQHGTSSSDQLDRYALHDGLEIERPCSALHTGDFTTSARDRPKLDLTSQPSLPSTIVDRTVLSSFSPSPSRSITDLVSTRGHAADGGDLSTRAVSHLRDGLCPSRNPQSFTPSRFNLPSDPTGGDAQAVHPSPVPSPFSSILPFPSPTAATLLRSPFWYRVAPTSPLVQSEINEDARPDVRPASRRHTMTSGAIGYRSTTLAPAEAVDPLLHLGFRGLDHPDGQCDYAKSNLASSRSQLAQSHPPNIDSGRAGSTSYRAHQPRRSTSSLVQLPGNAPSHAHNPTLPQAVRSSYSSDSSPLLHASMVGSYEESILSGRMSTNPSRPLDFLVQIGVLGVGRKLAVRCLPHVTLPFHAVFYSYGIAIGGSNSRHDDEPSPYVGQIDLENGLPNPDDSLRTRRKACNRFAEKRSQFSRNSTASLDPSPSRFTLPPHFPRGPADANSSANPNAGAGADAELDADVEMTTSPDLDTTDTRQESARMSARPKRAFALPKAPPGGSYRIPEKGQIQIVIKNQNKTAIKLFLVPYELVGMEPGTKTFIRQRSYGSRPQTGALPLRSGPLQSPTTPCPTYASSAAAHRTVLRYLVHLHICCPSRGRYYLYRSVRIVFANRVPDGKERLRTETTWPEPRFTPYKPVRVMHHPTHPPPPSHPLVASPILLAVAADKSFRRRSSGFAFPPASGRLVDDTAVPLLHLSPDHSERAPTGGLDNPVPTDSTAAAVHSADGSIGT